MLKSRRAPTPYVYGTTPWWLKLTFTSLAPRVWCFVCSRLCCDSNVLSLSSPSRVVFSREKDLLVVVRPIHVFPIGRSTTRALASLHPEPYA